MTHQTDPEAYEKKIIHRFVDFSGKHVLEVGCGDGRLTWKYGEAARRVTGFDIEMDDLRIARADRPAKLKDRITLTGASARYIPFPRETFDIAILAWSL